MNARRGGALSRNCIETELYTAERGGQCRLARCSGTLQSMYKVIMIPNMGVLSDFPTFKSSF